MGNPSVFCAVCDCAFDVTFETDTPASFEVSVSPNAE
jgi:hypothetical protein